MKNVNPKMLLIISNTYDKVVIFIILIFSLQFKIKYINFHQRIKSKRYNIIRNLL